nr:MAG TPA: hypothetical protein [Caudoviricetes sp.]
MLYNSYHILIVLINSLIKEILISFCHNTVARQQMTQSGKRAAHRWRYREIAPPPSGVTPATTTGQGKEVRFLFTSRLMLEKS